MAKKGQAAQLQTDVSSDEDWEKLMQKDGLIVVDIYSDWCGPCSGMLATLKKIKLEIGGDLLQLAMAKCDKITILERFRYKSEPTWMFISNGKMVNFMFGANSPKLTKLIIDELKRQADAKDGKRERLVQMEIGEMADEERERQEVIESQRRAAIEKEVEKAAKELYERRLAECQNIVENLQQFGVILVLPHARTSYSEAFGDLLGEAGLSIAQTEKITVQEQQLEELFYFSENPFPEDAMEELLNDISHVLLVKVKPGEDLIEPIGQVILNIIYGPSRKPPGDKDSPAKILERIEEEVEDQPPIVTFRVGVWVPEIDLEKGTALRLFFPVKTEHYLIPEPEPEPPHYAVVFEAFRRHEIKELMEKYEAQILRFGFFTSEVPEEARLIAKNLRQYEKHMLQLPYPEEKLVLQLSKKKSECILAFVSARPQYISPNADEGKRECSIFFPEGYDEPVPEEPEEEEKPQKKKKKKKKAAEPVEGEEGEKPEGGEEEDAVVPPSQRTSIGGPTSDGASQTGSLGEGGEAEGEDGADEGIEGMFEFGPDGELLESPMEPMDPSTTEPTPTEPTSTEPTTDVTTDEESPA